MKTKAAIAKWGLLLAVMALVSIPATRDEAHWRWASYRNDEASYRAYLKKWGGIGMGRHRYEADDRCEERAWMDAEMTNTVQGYERYLDRYPGEKHAAEARDRTDSRHWQQAKAANTIKGFEQYYRRHANGKHSAEAIERMAALRKSAGAKVVADYPRVVHADGSRYEWVTTFRETGGQTGFELRTLDVYIRDPDGGKWVSAPGTTPLRSRSVVTVGPGEATSSDYWYSYSEKWAGGTFHAEWFGEDDLGNYISIVQEVRLAK
jgi:hypothetical protein